MAKETELSNSHFNFRMGYMMHMDQKKQGSAFHTSHLIIRHPRQFIILRVLHHSSKANRMATAKLTIFTFLALSSFLIHSSFQARTLPSGNNPDHYTILDVSSAIQKTLHAISSQTPHKQNNAITTSSIPLFMNSSSFSVPLYPRETIKPEDHKSYESLVLSCLERDVARVSWINSKLWFRPKSKYISSPVASGGSQGTGEFFTQIRIGSPPKITHLAMDTGSDVTWIQCKPCIHCYPQTDPIFDPSNSRTYRTLSCKAPACLALGHAYLHSSAGVCHYQVSYGDGSFTRGDLITETLTLGYNGKFQKLAIGCGHDNQGLFFGSAGLLGLGGGKLSFPSQIKARSFSYCLPDLYSRASSTLDFNSARPGDSITTRLTKNNKIDTFLHITLTGLIVGGIRVDISPSLFALDAYTGRGGVIVDSGTSITRFTSKAYIAFRDLFRSQFTGVPSAAGMSLFDTCYDMSSIASATVPTVQFVFGNEGKTLTLPPKNCLIPMDSRGTFCLAFAGTRSSSSIIGNVQQQGFRVSFDLANRVVGFSPNKC